MTYVLLGCIIALLFGVLCVLLYAYYSRSFTFCGEHAHVRYLVLVNAAPKRETLEGEVSHIVHHLQRLSYCADAMVVLLLSDECDEELVKRCFLISESYPCVYTCRTEHLDGLIQCHLQWENEKDIIDEE